MDSKSTFDIVPLDHGRDSKANFGAAIYGLDLGNITDDELARLQNAVMQYKVVIVKKQFSLTPKKNWELLQRLDPEAASYNTEEFGKLFHPTGQGIIEKLRVATVPDAGQIHLIGKGYQGDDHYGMKKLNLGEAFANSYYSKPLSEEEFEQGITRFQSWHMDGPLYKVNPPMISSFRIIKFPVGEQEVDWADGSGLKKRVAAGRTAFFSTSQLYSLFSDEEKKMVDHSWVEYMFYPYEWIRACHGNPNGLGVASEGQEVPDQQLAELAPDRDPSWTRVLPMVWVNPTTGERAFQVQPNCVRRLFVRHNANDPPKVIEDVAEVRDFLSRLQTRIVKPEYIYAGPEDEGDHLLWFNWGLMHSRIDYPIKFGPRITHQGWIPSSRVPTGPVPIPQISSVRGPEALL